MTGLTNPLQLATVHLLPQNRQPGIGLPELQADTTATRAVFLCPQHGKPVMGGPCVALARVAGSCSR
jgi:hypothetical protein